MKKLNQTMLHLCLEKKPIAASVLENKPDFISLADRSYDVWRNNLSLKVRLFFVEILGTYVL